jgi:hypothetical protein
MVEMSLSIQHEVGVFNLDPFALLIKLYGARIVRPNRQPDPPDSFIKEVMGNALQESSAVPFATKLLKNIESIDFSYSALVGDDGITKADRAIAILKNPKAAASATNRGRNSRYCEFALNIVYDRG